MADDKKDAGLVRAGIKQPKPTKAEQAARQRAAKQVVDAERRRTARAAEQQRTADAERLMQAQQRAQEAGRAVPESLPTSISGGNRFKGAQQHGAVDPSNIMVRLPRDESYAKKQAVRDRALASDTLSLSRVIGANTPLPSPSFVPAAEVLNDVDRMWNTNMVEFSELSQKLNAASFKNDGSLAQVKSAYQAALLGAAYYSDKYDPDEYLALIASGSLPKPGGSGFDAGGGGNGGGFSSTSTSYQVNLTNPSEARKLIDGTLSGYLGRQATKDERSEFLKALNRLEESNPQVSRSSTSGVSSGGHTSSTTRSDTSGGIDKGQVAVDYAKSRDDYAEQEFGRYVDVLTDEVMRRAGGL